MSLREAMKADLSVFYNTDEFAKKCIFRGLEVPVRILKPVEFFEVDFEHIKGRVQDFQNIEEGEILNIVGKSYSIANFNIEDDFEIRIALKEEND